MSHSIFRFSRWTKLNYASRVIRRDEVSYFGMVGIKLFSSAKVADAAAAQLVIQKANNATDQGVRACGALGGVVNTQW